MQCICVWLCKCACFCTVLFDQHQGDSCSCVCVCYNQWNQSIMPSQASQTSSLSSVTHLIQSEDESIDIEWLHSMNSGLSGFWLWQISLWLQLLWESFQSSKNGPFPLVPTYLVCFLSLFHIVNRICVVFADITLGSEKLWWWKYVDMV